MAQHVDIFERRDPWKGAFSASLAFHGAIFGLIVAYGAWIGVARNEWGSGANTLGDTISANLVSASSIPLPRETPTQNIVANESSAPAHSEPKEVAPPQPEAIPIPETTKIKPKERPRETPEKHPQPVHEAETRVPFGGGGQVHENFTTFSATAGIGAVGITARRDFGSRYAYYVRQVTQVLSQNWLKYEGK